MLDDHSSISDPAVGYQITDLDFNEVAPAQFAVDRKVKQGSIPYLARLVEHEANGPHLFGLQWSLSAKLTYGELLKQLAGSALHLGLMPAL